MKKIYKWALGMCGVSDAVTTAVSMLRTEEAERFVEVVVGCDITPEDVPQEVVYEGKVCKLLRCNYILNMIVYVTDDTDCRYFPNQEDADKYSASGDYSWGNSSSSVSDKYPIKSAWTRPCEHSTYYERWFSWADKEM